MRYKWKLKNDERSVDYLRVDGPRTNLMAWIWLPKNKQGVYMFSVNRRHRKDGQHCHGECNTLREAMRMVKLIVAVEENDDEVQ